MILHEKVQVSLIYDTIFAINEAARSELDACKVRIQHISSLEGQQGNTSETKNVILDCNGPMMTLHKALGKQYIRCACVEKGHFNQEVGVL